jgi:hypothetical protein
MLMDFRGYFVTFVTDISLVVAVDQGADYASRITVDIWDISVLSYVQFTMNLKLF